jgi:hypothetical protein
MPDSFSEGSFQEVVMRGVASVLLVLVVCVTAYAADIDGTWTGTVQTPMGDFPVTFTFKADGAKLTGSTMGFDGADVPIQDGKIDGNTATWAVTFDFGGMPLMLTYKGVVSGTEMKVTADALGMPVEFALKKAAK